MKDQSKTKHELLEENAFLKQKIQELKHSESDCKQVEEVLRESEERLRDIIFSIVDWVWEVDENGVYTYSSQKGFDFFGESRGDIIGKRPFDFMPPDEAKRVAAIFSDIVVNKAPIKDLENLNIGKNGERIYLLTNGVPILDKEGNLKGFRGVDKDITSSKLAEEALRESDELFRSNLEYAPDGVFMSDVNGNFLYVNRKCEEIIGYRREELIGKNFLELNILPEKSLNKAARLLQANIEGKSTGPDEIELIRKEGRIIPVEINSSVVQRMGQGIVIAFVRDITKRKQAETEKEESKALIEAVVENVPLMIFLKEATDLRFVLFNRAGEELLGYDRRDLIGKNNLDLFPPEQAAHFMAKDREVLDGESGMLDIPEEPILTAKKGQRLLHTRKICIRGSDGATKFLLGISDDITDRKLAEEALRESEEKYRLVVENAAEIILVAQDGLLKYVNPMAVKILGYPEEVLTSMPFVKLIHPEDVKKVFEAHMRIMRGEENQPVNQFRVVPLDGAIRWADSRAVVISWEGKPATVNFITDITGRKRMEEEILALSITDQLTGLHNRRGFLSLAEQQLKLSDRNKSGMLLFFADLDSLKWINDELGHEEGDKALIEAATVFRETFRTSDIVARLGGDEFAVLAVNLTDANSKTAAARLQQLIDIRNNQENRRYRLSISMGCAYYDPENPCSIDDLIARADKLMYEQKQSKKNLLMKNGLYFNK